MTAMAANTTSQQTGNRANLVRMLAPTARDVLVPLVAYYALHWAGYSDFIALLGGAVASAVLVLSGVIRARRLDALAALILIGFVVGLGASMISGDPRLMIVRDSLTTAGIGLAFLISAVLGKPLTYSAARKAVSGDPQKLAEMEHAFTTNPVVRRAHNRIAAMWGVGLAGESALRVVLAYQLPIATMAWLSTVMMVATFSVLMVITARTIKSIKRSQQIGDQGYASVHE